MDQKASCNRLTELGIDRNKRTFMIKIAQSIQFSSRVRYTKYTYGQCGLQNVQSKKSQGNLFNVLTISYFSAQECKNTFTTYPS